MMMFNFFKSISYMIDSNCTVELYVACFEINLFVCFGFVFISLHKHLERVNEGIPKGTFLLL